MNYEMLFVIIKIVVVKYEWNMSEEYPLDAAVQHYYQKNYVAENDPIVNEEEKKKLFHEVRHQAEVDVGFRSKIINSYLQDNFSPKNPSGPAR